MHNGPKTGSMALGPFQFSMTINLGHIISVLGMVGLVIASYFDLKGDVKVIETTHSTLSRRVDRDQASNERELIELRLRTSANDVAIARVEEKVTSVKAIAERIEQKLNEWGNVRSGR